MPLNKLRDFDNYFIKVKRLFNKLISNVANFLGVMNDPRASCGHGGGRASILLLLIRRSFKCDCPSQCWLHCALVLLTFRSQVSSKHDPVIFLAGVDIIDFHIHLHHPSGNTTGGDSWPFQGASKRHAQRLG